MKQILLIGAGGHCKSCIDVIEHLDKLEIAGVVTQVKEDISEFMGYPVIGSDEDLGALRTKFENAFIGIGQINTPLPRLRIYQKLKELEFKLPSIVSPLAYVSEHAHVGEGTIVMHDAMINAGAIVNEGCIINSKSLLEHDAEIESFCHISTGAIINGSAVVGENSFIGSNATVVNGVSVTAGTFVKAGSIVA